MKTILKTLNWVFACVFILSACEKKPEAPISPVHAKGKLQKIVWADGTQDEFEYNTQGLLEKRTFKEKTGEIEIMNFEYNAQNQLLKISKNTAMNYQLFYKDDLIEKVDEKAGNTLVNRYLYKFNSQKQLIEQITLFVLANGQSYETEKATFTYYENGNLGEIKIYFKSLGLDEFELAETVRYELYDDKVNPGFFGYMHPFIPTLPMQKNNALRVRTLSANPQLSPLIEEYEFAYNTEGKPTSAKFEANGAMNLRLNGNFLYY
ncbi:MAG: hypothetical protein MUE85_21275 [Microscillaceae bacterium]|nr:hypothetical protein [Microscillaceae bacterium]